MSTGAAPRVVVTGLGAVSAFGWGCAELWEGLAAGRSGLAEARRFSTRGHRTRIAGEVPPPPAGLASLPGWRRSTRADRFAVATALEALAAAGLGASLAGRRAGVYFSSSTGGMPEGEVFYAALAHPGHRLARHAGGRRAALAQVAGQQVSAPGEAVARRLAVGGPVETVSSACASGTLALGLALDALRAGEVEVALVGGADALCQVTYGGFNALRSVDERRCRPFSRDRAGLSLGEGGAALVLETAAGAAARGAEPLAELAGTGATADAHHMTAPEPGGAGAARALTGALADAGMSAGEIAFVNAHGTGTPLNDAAEWRALAAVFGDAAGRLPVTATKGCVGHLLGSAGALEAVATVLCLVHGAVHPTPLPAGGDPEAAVDLVTSSPRPLPAAAAGISLNLAFGGCNAAAVLRRSPAASPA